MSEPELQPDAVAFAAETSDMARGLASTLQAAPARESGRAAALRRYLLASAHSLAELSADARRVSTPYDRESARLLVEQIRHIAADLAAAPPPVPPGIGVVLHAFAEQLLPATLLVLRPHGHWGYTYREHLGRFYTLAERAQLPDIPIANTPREMLVLRYPQGEQDNVLLACNFLRAFCPPAGGPEMRRDSDLFATRLLGPAYFFAFAVEVERIAPHNADYTRLRLCRVSDLLRDAGWFDHPDLGPLLLQWREQFGFHATYVQERIQASGGDPHFRHEEWRAEQEADTRRYQPADFDRDVPRLSERLSQLLPPNDLELDSVENAQPADAVSILNAGWSFALLHMEDLYRILGSHTPEDRYEARQVLNRLLTKGIELSHIARLWRQAREAA